MTFCLDPVWALPRLYVLFIHGVVRNRRHLAYVGTIWISNIASVMCMGKLQFPPGPRYIKISEDQCNELPNKP